MREWRKIPGWPYEASNDGLIRRSDTKRLRKNVLGKKGYYEVTLHNNGKVTNRVVSRLVLMAFTGEDREYPTWHACHYDGCKTNNFLENLYWGKPYENEADKIRHGRDNGGARHYKSKIDNTDAENIRKSYAEIMQNRKQAPKGWLKQQSNKYNMSEKAIWQIATGRTYARS